MEDPETTRRAESSEPDPSAGSTGESGEGGGFRERGRKERVLHTRISEQLAEDIRRVAEDLRVPVSNLVRNVLEETFSVVESVTDNLGTWLEEVATEVGPARGPSRQRQRRWARPWAREREEAPPGARDDTVWENSRGEPSSITPETSARGEPPAGISSVRDDETATERAAPSGAGSAEARPDFCQVLGWQPLVMNRPQSCSDCGRLLVRGDRASLGLTPSGVSGWVLCRACMEARE